MSISKTVWHANSITNSLYIFRWSVRENADLGCQEGFLHERSLNFKDRWVTPFLYLLLHYVFQAIALLNSNEHEEAIQHVQELAPISTLLLSNKPCTRSGNVRVGISTCTIIWIVPVHNRTWVMKLWSYKVCFRAWFSGESFQWCHLVLRTVLNRSSLSSQARLQGAVACISSWHKDFLRGYIDVPCNSLRSYRIVVFITWKQFLETLRPDPLSLIANLVSFTIVQCLEAIVWGPAFPISHVPATRNITSEEPSIDADRWQS